MSINLVVAVTDGDWFDTLRQQPNPDEVNFRAPSAATFRALQPGEMFLFKLHAPHNFIVGWGRLRLTKDTAVRLGRYFGTSPEFWINL